MLENDETHISMVKAFLALWEYGREEDLHRIYHKDFIGFHNNKKLDFDSILKRFHYSRQHYRPNHHALLRLMTISDDAVFILSRWTAIDKEGNKPIETIISRLITLKENQIIQTHTLSEKTIDLEIAATETRAEDLSTELTYKTKLDERIRLLSVEHASNVTLTIREKDCLYCYLMDIPAKEAAKQFNISDRTFQKHIDNIRKKYHLSRVSQLRALFQLI